MGVKASAVVDDIVKALLEKARLPREAEGYLRGRVELAVTRAVAEEREAVAAYLDEYHAAEAPVRRLAEEIRGGEHLKVGESDGTLG